MTTQTYRRARHSGSLLHAHLVFVTKYRRRVFTDAMLTHYEHTMRAVCNDLNAELVEFNSQADHVHLLAAYPPTLAISVRCSDSRAAPLTPCAANTPLPVSAPASADTSGHHPTSPYPAAAHHRRSSSNTSTDKPDHSDHRATPSNKPGWAHPATNGEACAQEFGHVSTHLRGERRNHRFADSCDVRR